MERKDSLIDNLQKLHITDLGVLRLKRNLDLEVADVIIWCQGKIIDPTASITQKGKNWYIDIDGIIITVNAYSYTIITAHKKIR